MSRQRKAFPKVTVRQGMMVALKRRAKRLKEISDELNRKMKSIKKRSNLSKRKLARGLSAIRSKGVKPEKEGGR